MKLLGRIVLTLLALGLIAAGGGALYLQRLTGPAGGPKTTLEIKPGTTLASVAGELERRQVVKSADALRAIMRVRGTAGSLKDGLYDLSGDLTAFEVADKLAGAGRPRIVTVTIPEGKRLRDIPAIFEKSGLVSAEELRRALSPQGETFKKTAHVKNTLEGFLFPATYPFRPEATADEIVGILTARMEEEFTPERVASAKKLGLDVFGWVTLASMVQAEAANAQEMPVIAGVFLNRLDDGMTLGSDPTVAYGLGKDLPELDRFAGDFQKDTPYNTYTRGGLPKGPINNPGEAALLSVLSAKRTMADGKRALYFLHGDKGEFRVNATYDAHLRDNARFR